MNKALIIDVETSISNKGQPFDLTNKLVMVGTKSTNAPPITQEWSGSDVDIETLQHQVDHASILVAFNAKFDLHWIRRAGIDISKVKVWDCQIAEFLLNFQKTPYPSLDQAAEKYGFEKKLDIVKLNYWSKGIDTDEIPPNILSDYLVQDLLLTEQVFFKQRELFEGEFKYLYTLFRIQCQDLLVLEEMEWNGILFSTEKAKAKANELEKELNEIIEEFNIYTGGIPINLNSNDHVSVLLYGGTIAVDGKIPIGVFKTGTKIGQVRYKIITKEYPLPRIVEPLKGTEVKGKEDKWLVNETVLRKLKLTKEAKKVVGLLNRYAELDKLRGTYLIGYSTLIEKMNWEKDTLHGTLNQCSVITGRLASTKPNLQNMNPEIKTYCESRYV